MKVKKEKKSRRYQFAVSPSFGSAFDAFCKETGRTRTEVFTEAVAELIHKEYAPYVQG